MRHILQSPLFSNRTSQNATYHPYYPESIQYILSSLTFDHATDNNKSRNLRRAYDLSFFDFLQYINIYLYIVRSRKISQQRWHRDIHDILEHASHWRSLPLSIQLRLWFITRQANREQIIDQNNVSFASFLRMIKSICLKDNSFQTITRFQ